MGFWTDKEKEENKPSFGQSDSFQNSFSQTFNSYRSCKNDPEDNEFLICKNISQSLNKDGEFEKTESEEERIPADQFYNNMTNPFQGISPLFGIFEGLMNQSSFPLSNGFENIQQQSQTENKNNSFFGKLKSLFTDDSLEKEIQQYYNQFQNNLVGEKEGEQQLNNPQQHSSFKKQFSRTSSSRRCEQDPQDENYLICTTTIKKNLNGQDSTETQQERIQKNVQQQNEIFPNQMHDLMRDINLHSGFQIPSFFGPFPNFGEAMPTQEPFSRQNNASQQNRQGNDYSRNKERNQSENDYKYPQYEEKKPKAQNGIYDI